MLVGSMSITSPFLTRNGPFACEPAATSSSARAISSPANPPPPIPKLHAAAPPAFTNSRRVVRLIPLSFALSICSYNSRHTTPNVIPSGARNLLFPLFPSSLRPPCLCVSLSFFSLRLYVITSLLQFFQVNLRIPHLVRL